MPGISTQAPVAAAVEVMARRIGALGHRVEHVWPRWPTPTDAFVPQFYAGMREEAESVEHPDRLEPRTRQTVALSRWATPRLVDRAMRRGEAIADALDARVLGDADVLVLPVMPGIAPGAGLLDDLDTIRAQLATVPHVANMAIFNVSGHPAISVPAGFDEARCADRRPDRRAPRS